MSEQLFVPHIRIDSPRAALAGNPYSGRAGSGRSPASAHA
tara:strand:- start:235 stop:354 length:120 start_codon:yes stop_codon:yes gene_type:complete